MPFDFPTVFHRALPYTPFLQRYATDEHRRRWQTLYDAVSLTPDQRQLLASFRRQMYVLCLAGPWCGDCVNACPIFQRFAEACPFIDLRFINRAQDFDAATRAAQASHPAGAGGGGGGGPNFASAPAPAGTADDPDDIRSRPIGKILVKWGILTPERIDKALLVQEERKAQGLNARIGDVMTDLGFISSDQRDQALAAQSGFPSFDSWDVAVARELSICGGPRVPVLVFLSEDWFECERFGERTLSTYREKARKKLSTLEGASCPTGLFAPHEDILARNTAEWLNHFERVQWMLLTSPRLSKKHGES